MQDTATPLKPKILVVEDDPISRTTICRLLEKMGYSAASAENGQRALSVLDAEEFDCVLMDILMPVMNGIEATMHIRKGYRAGANAKISIVAMTAYAMPGDREKYLQAGMDDFIPKPVEVEILDEILKRMINKKHRE